MSLHILQEEWIIRISSLPEFGLLLAYAASRKASNGSEVVVEKFVNLRVPMDDWSRIAAAGRSARAPGVDSGSRCQWTRGSFGTRAAYDPHCSRSAPIVRIFVVEPRTKWRRTWRVGRPKSRSRSREMK